MLGPLVSLSIRHTTGQQSRISINRLANYRRVHSINSPPQQGSVPLDLTFDKDRCIFMAGQIDRIKWNYIIGLMCSYALGIGLTVCYAKRLDARQRKRKVQGFEDLQNNEIPPEGVQIQFIPTIKEYFRNMINLETFIGMLCPLPGVLLYYSTRYYLGRFVRYLHILKGGTDLRITCYHFSGNPIKYVYRDVPLCEVTSASPFTSGPLDSRHGFRAHKLYVSQEPVPYFLDLKHGHINEPTLFLAYVSFPFKKKADKEHRQ